MKYGPNTALVEEVINFVKSGNLLVPTNKDGALKNVHIIIDFERAKALAWDEEYGWTDRRENEMSKVMEGYYETEDLKEYKEELDKLLDTFVMYLRRRLKGMYSEIFDDVVADLYNCAFNRAVNGNDYNFFEQLFEVYRKGGWPCGWQDNHPQGKLTAYFPSINSSLTNE
ncbi:hypothetical protein [Aneurinibacillus thermoaerophilus]|jgi:hypothetical protein|uniref:hypothetical protein n=1 Tax=Aneurinibacillus thermoaerophilus TaxID=143495 RepID=UPI002E1E7569|nr:hypothetical protein [Aneurinibacillus thermoaerophilus]MED0738800.1 hypothetical protein [Aneurinibacillus thermoaerophilus]MED0756138.1 hypothetical protein [Aneurinibacillus thermoaerophilus]MED0762262.1 hypothetical protein [Aneurinibacillus thermoaerophilus]MED0766321.1 hypothetical protein [Aneurinibacillus thermoaerophilus]